MSEDSQLTALAARRSETDLRAAQSAFAELYERHAGSLVAFLSSRVTRSDLDDVHQTVWARVWQSLPKSDTAGHFRGWLFQITRNYLIDRSRRRHDEPTDIADREGFSQSPADTMLELDEQLTLQRCLDRLPKEQKDLVRGRLAGEDYETIGPRLNLPAARLHKMFFEAKSQLQSCVQEGEL